MNKGTSAALVALVVMGSVFATSVVASIDIVPPSGTTFSASLGGGALATVVNPVPMLNDLALMLLTALLAAAGMLAHARRKRA